MNKKILSLLILLIITPCLMAQKKELSQARSDIKNNRNFIGIEIDSVYFEIAKERINKENEEHNGNKN